MLRPPPLTLQSSVSPPVGDFPVSASLHAAPYPSPPLGPRGTPALGTPRHTHFLYFLFHPSSPLPTPPPPPHPSAASAPFASSTHPGLINNPPPPSVSISQCIRPRLAARRLLSLRKAVCSLAFGRLVEAWS